MMSLRSRSSLAVVSFLALLLPNAATAQQSLATGPAMQVMELSFQGPPTTPADQPTMNVPFFVRFVHEASGDGLTVWGYWDGDGQGGNVGDVYKVRFTPTRPGAWVLEKVHAPGTPLHGQHQGDRVVATESAGKGFWVADPDSNGGRWFRRSAGGHDYLVGNTHYDFLFAPHGNPATPQTIATDVRDNARFFNKLRFCLMQPRKENAAESPLPFLDEQGQPTAKETDQPNPAFFSQRVDVAVLEAAKHDLVADLIMGGSTGDQIATREGFIRYVAARYGAFPNVWFTIGQEWNEQSNPAEQQRVGAKLQEYLAYPSPVSTHATRGWTPALNGDWVTHAIRQGKFDKIAEAADAIVSDYQAVGGKPVVNDENGYDPGENSTPDVVEGVVGSFLGGGYGTVGHKTDSKKGGYFWGHAALGQQLESEHPSAPRLGFLREAVNEHVPFWRLAPMGAPSAERFAGAPEGFRVLGSEGETYVLGSNRAASVTANLPDGSWKVVQLDVMKQKQDVLSESASGTFAFETPASRAGLTIFVNTAADLTVAAADAQPMQVAGQAQPLRVATVSEDLSAGEVGTKYADDLEAEGGQPPYTWSVVQGALPQGLSIDGSEFTGTPETSGRHQVTLRVTDATGRTAEQQVTVQVHGKPKEVTIIDDPLTGSTSGELLGGELTREGYVPTDTQKPSDAHILYRLPHTVSRGYMEFEVKGLDHSKVAEDGDVGLFGMYDGRGIDEPATYFGNYKNNFYRYNLHYRQNKGVLKTVLLLAEPTPERLQADRAVTDTVEGRDFTEETNGRKFKFDPEAWHKIRVNWDHNEHTVEVDGQRVIRVGNTPYPYAPVEHRLWFGSAPGKGRKYTAQLPGLTFRNLKLVELQSTE